MSSDSSMPWWAVGLAGMLLLHVSGPIWALGFLCVVTIGKLITWWEGRS
jgi:hypothetical protein